MKGSVRRRRLAATSGTAIIVAALLVASSGQALGGVGPTETCNHGGNPSATACVNGKDGETYSGGFDDFRNVDMSVTTSTASNPQHINNEMWVYTHADESQFVETGLRSGYWAPCDCHDYVRFWAAFDSAGNEHRHTIGFPSKDNSEHTYEILRSDSPTTYWNVYLDYNLVGTSNTQNSSHAYEIQWGLEDTDVSPNAQAHLANHSPLEYMDNSGGFQHVSYTKQHVDAPCSPDTSTGDYCLTGYKDGIDVWKDAKG